MLSTSPSVSNVNPPSCRDPISVLEVACVAQIPCLSALGRSTPTRDSVGSDTSYASTSAHSHLPTRVEQAGSSQRDFAKAMILSHLIRFPRRSGQRVIVMALTFCFLVGSSRPSETWMLSVNECDCWTHHLGDTQPFGQALAGDVVRRNRGTFSVGEVRL